MYQPISEWEQTEFDKSVVDILPDDVKNDFDKCKDIQVAWTGVILELDYVENEENIILTLLIEHHYYDWVEDFGIQQEIYFLSERGEGLFETKWALKKQSDMSNIQEQIGNFIIAYGFPRSIENDLILFDSTYIYYYAINSCFFNQDFLA